MEQNGDQSLSLKLCSDYIHLERIRQGIILNPQISIVCDRTWSCIRVLSSE